MQKSTTYTQIACKELSEEIEKVLLCIVNRTGREDEKGEVREKNLSEDPTHTTLPADLL